MESPVHSVYVPHHLSDGNRGAEHQRIMDEVAVVEAADRSGFKYTWVTEHHFLTEYSHMSANEVFLGYLAARTEAHPSRLGIFT